MLRGVNWITLHFPEEVSSIMEVDREMLIDSLIYHTVVRRPHCSWIFSGRKTLLFTLFKLLSHGSLARFIAGADETLQVTS